MERNNSANNIIMNQLANSLKLDIDKDCDEILLTLPKNHGEGIIRGIRLPFGININVFQCTFNKPVQIFQNTSYTCPPLRFIYVKKGALKYTYNESNIHCELTADESAISAGDKNSNDLLAFHQNEELEIVILEINRVSFIEKIQCDLNSIENSLANVFRDTQGNNVFHWTSHFSVGITECLESILSCQRDQTVKRYFFEGKIYEILSHQFKQFADDIEPKGNEMVLRQNDISLIREAKKILTENLEEAPTIVELSRMVGINQQKLKKGFKQIYNTTPYKYLRNTRLNESKLLLIEGSSSVSEVAEKIGYSNKSHFAKRFKEKFGVLPREFVKEFKANI
ncbi:MAG: AraC family transcriptional regulator [Chitinophagales bacterium]